MKKNTNVMACGCVVILEEDGKTFTSVDALVNGIQRLFARSETRQAQARTASAHV